MIVLSRLFLYFYEGCIYSVFSEHFLSWLYQSCDNSWDQEKGEYEPYYFPYPSLSDTQTFIYIYFWFPHFCSIEQSIIRKSQTNNQRKEPDNERKKYEKRNDSKNNGCNSSSSFCEKSKRYYKHHSYENRSEHIKRYPPEYTYIRTEVLSWKVEIFGIGKFSPLEIWFIDIHHEKITICIGTYENSHYTEYEKSRDDNSSYIIEYEFFWTGCEAELIVIGKILIHDTTYKWQWYYKTKHIGIEENACLWDIPMKKILVEEYEILENLSELTLVWWHKL